MITTFIRSSSYGTWDFCSHQYYLRYVLGLPDRANKKATKGSICHKALELLAKRKLAEQESVATVHDEETGLTKPRHLITPESAMAAAWDYYTRVEDYHDWQKKDLRDCTKWVKQGMEYRDGLYNPLKRTVVKPEQYFSFTIDEPWASYSFKMPDGSVLEGQLALKGTIDLLTRHPVGVLEYLDWKSGAEPKDWATGKLKDFHDFCDDFQLRLYHYALCRLYPDENEIFTTIFYLQQLKPFSIPFTRDDLKKTEQMLRKRFELIKSTTNPPWIRDNPKHNWKCQRLCHYGKQIGESGKTICQEVKSSLLQVGMERTNAKYMDVKSISSYGSGGGSSNRE